MEKCNGCGTEIVSVDATYVYGEHVRTFCELCHRVLMDIIMSSDLSEHHHKYES